MYCELHLASVWGENARPVVPGVVYYPRGVVYYPQTDRGNSSPESVLPYAIALTGAAHTRVYMYIDTGTSSNDDWGRP